MLRILIFPKFEIHNIRKHDIIEIYDYIIHNLIPTNNYINIKINI